MTLIEQYPSWREAMKHAETLSDAATVDEPCPMCQQKPGARCVTKSGKVTKTHTVRNEQAVFMGRWQNESQAAMKVRAAERKREHRIAEGLTPEEHAADCFCDEECWPMKLEGAETGVEWAESRVQMWEGQLAEARQELAEAEQGVQEVHSRRLRWEIARRDAQ